MRKIIDISGNRYGRWTVIERSDRKTSSGSWMYLCKCDCGTLKEVSGTLLRQGKSTSCGCFRNQMLSEQSKGKRPPNYKDLRGKRFGKLTVVEETGVTKWSYIEWKCQCDCGKTVNVISGDLLSGNTKSCGCLCVKDLSGKRFGMLVAIEPTDKRKYNSIVWRCKCDCGKEAFVAADYLKEGRVSSCGCNKTKNIQDKRYGRLVAKRPIEQRDKFGNVVWECLCDCGKTHFASVNSLESGNTLSCGCKGKELWENTRNIFETQELVDGTALCNLTNKLRVDNTSGHKGVYWVEKAKLWRVSITIQKKTHHIGYFKDYEQAVIAREEAEEKYFNPVLERNGRSKITHKAAP